MPQLTAPIDTTPRRGGFRWALPQAIQVGAWLVLAACSNAPPAPAPKPAPPPVPTLQELMAQASTAAKEGRREAARMKYREAAKIYPVDKAPWSSLAEDYFEATDYGNAILASQEVLQRDPQNTLAHSILAVSGLRVSTTALSALRDQQSGLPINTREQATALAGRLREVLGEPVLVPPGPVKTPTTPPRSTTASPTVKPAGPPRTAAPAASQPCPVTGGNPFARLGTGC